MKPSERIKNADNLTFEGEPLEKFLEEEETKEVVSSISEDKRNLSRCLPKTHGSCHPDPQGEKNGPCILKTKKGIRRYAMKHSKDSTRMKIVNVLLSSENKLSTTELMEVLEISRSGIHSAMYNLNKYRTIIASTKAGKFSCYYIHPDLDELSPDQIMERSRRGFPITPTVAPKKVESYPERKSMERKIKQAFGIPENININVKVEIAFKLA